MSLAGLRARLPVLSLRSRLVVLVLLALLPAVAFFIDQAAQDRERLLAGAQSRALRLARAWAANHDGLVREAGLLLEAARRDPAIAEPALAQCGPALRRLAQQTRWPSDLLVLERGAVRCASNSDAALYALPPAFIDDLAANDGLEVSEFQLDGQGRPIAFAGIPVPAPRGRDERAVVAIIDLAEIQRRTAPAAEGARYDVMVIGRSGTVLARLPSAADFVGMPLGEHPLMPQLMVKTEGTAAGRGLDGIDRLFAFTQLPQTGAKLSVGLPRAEVLGAQAQDSDRRFAILAAMAAVTLAGAWLLAEFAVLRWVRVLGRTADAFGRGNLAHRAEVSPAAGEFARLASAFNRMATALEARSAALSASERRFRDIAEVAGDFFWERDRDGRYTFLSERFTEVTGIPAGDVMNKLPEQITAATFAGDEVVRLRAAFADREPFRNLLLRVTLQGGEIRWWRVSGSPFYDELSGEFRGFRGAGSEVTAAQRADEELRLAKEAAEAASRAKSEFLATMSHELRTPLNAIIGFSEVIHGEMFGPIGVPAYHDYVGDILNSGRHLLALINDILDFAKADAGRLQLDIGSVDLVGLARGAARTLEPQADAAQLALAVLAEEPQLLVAGDERRLRQVLLNLIGNAIKFTPAGGQIAVALGLTPDGRPQFSVRDSGIGIAEDELPYVVEPFRQADQGHARGHEGAGLGLAICDRIVALHGGILSITSRLGEGTVVTVILPRERSIAVAEAIAPPAARGRADFRVIGGGRT